VIAESLVTRSAGRPALQYSIATNSSCAAPEERQPEPKLNGTTLVQRSLLLSRWCARTPTFSKDLMSADIGSNNSASDSALKAGAFFDQ
jgi:hypothetical protein